MRRSAVLGAGLVCSVVAVGCAAAMVTSQGNNQSSPSTCSGPRWRVKTLSDVLAGRVSDHPKQSSIAALRKLHAPRRLNARSPRRRGPERTTYHVNARLVEMELEKDGDVILVAIDPTTKDKLAAEFPASGCTRRASAEHRRRMSGARAALIAACGKPMSTGNEIGGSATITGVGFFEPGDGVPPEAPNRFELHPVVGFSAKCVIGAQPSQ
jgi:hypothetical protein